MTCEVSRTWLCAQETDTEGLAAELAQAWLTCSRAASQAPAGGAGIIHLDGELGAGKTTFARGVLRAMGHSGPVKSPTYTLVEPYALAALELFHFDLYRLNDPEELELIGAREYFGNPGALCLVEWPQRAAGRAGEPDLVVTMTPKGDAVPGREVRVAGLSGWGKTVLSALSHT